MAEIDPIKTSAPGSLMLLGEHAVLHGHRALVAAINLRINIHLFPVEEKCVEIQSALGNYHAPLDQLVDHSSFTFVLQAIRQHQSNLPSGFKLYIASDFSADIGFGSSSAVTVATHAALLQWLNNKEPEPHTLFNVSLETIRAVQGRGSGADVAASVFGGMVGYTTEPSFDPVGISVPLTAVYCGYKTPTAEVIMKVEQKRSANADHFAQIYAEIDAGVEKAVDLLRAHDFPGFGAVLNRNHELMNEIGVNTPELQEIVSVLQNSPDVFGAKISGSGLGDCAIGIGYASLPEMDYPVHHLEITPLGCAYHD